MKFWVSVTLIIYACANVPNGKGIEIYGISNHIYQKQIFNKQFSKFASYQVENWCYQMNLYEICGYWAE